MGKTAFSGPVFGAKSALWNVFVPVVSSGTTTQTVAVTRVPTYEDWYATEALYRCSSCSTGAALASSVASFVIKDDGSSLHVASIMANTNTVALVSITPTPGEWQGLRIAGGSTLALVARGGDSAVPAESLWAELRGYIRFTSSTSYSE